MVQCTGFPSNVLIVIFANLTLLSLDLGCTNTVVFCSGGLFSWLTLAFLLNALSISIIHFLVCLLKSPDVLINSSKSFSSVKPRISLSKGCSFLVEPSLGIL